MATLNSTTYKKIGIVIAVVSGLFLFSYSITHAVSIFVVQQGGTGVGTFTPGIVSGNGTNPLYTIATTSVTCSGSTTCTSFTAIGGSPITISSSGGTGSGNVATSSSEVANEFPFWTSTAGTPATLNGTSSLFRSGANIVVGNASTIPVDGTTGMFEVIGTSSNTAQAQARFGTAAGSAPRYLFAKSDGATIGDFTAVTTDDILGVIQFSGSDGVSFGGTPATITARASQPFTVGNTGSYLTFSTVAGGTTAVEAMRVSQRGNVIIGNSASQNASVDTATGRLIVVATTTDTTADSYVAQSLRGAIVSGNQIGNLAFRSNDSSLTAPGADVASIAALASGTHTASSLPTDLTFSTIPTSSIVQAERLRITSEGLVGIGTSTPGAALDVQGVAANMPFRVSSSTGASLFEIEQNGNVGVGTTTAWGALSVKNNSGINQLVLAYDDTNYAQFNVTNTGLLSITSSANNGIVFSTVGTRRFVVSGNTFISNVTGGPQLSNLASSATVPVLIPNRSDTTTGIGADASGNISLITAATTKVELLSNGNLGIGSTTPGSLLSIGGSGAGINFSTATTTFTNVGGINLTTGCYAVNNVCISAGGGSTSPGGLNTQVQYNNAGVFGGISGATTNGTILSLTNPLLGGATLTTSSVNGVTLTTGGSATSYLNGTGAYSVPAGTTYTGTYPIVVTGTTISTALASSTLTASSPLTGSFAQVGTGGSLGCQTASGSQAGCLSAADWTTFNGKGSGTVTSVGLSDANSTLTIGSTPVTTSGTITATLNLAHGNTFTALQQFAGNASTTNLSSTGTSYFGGTATTTISSIGSITTPANSILKLGTTTAGTLKTSSAGVVYADTAGGTTVDTQDFTASGTWTKPASAGASSVVCVQSWGAGGGGGGGGVTNPGGGGGGGAYTYQCFPAPSVGSTVTVTVGGTTAAATQGAASSFGTTVIAYGGGAGGVSVTTTKGGGAGGGGQASAGANASGATGGIGGGYTGGALTITNQGFDGAGGCSANGTGSPGNAGQGGGGGGCVPSNTANPVAGGNSTWGGGGGGAGIDTASGNAPGAGGLSIYGGAGGTGGKTSVGGNGSIRGGGGGGGGKPSSAGGTGGRGEIIVYTYP